MAGIKQTALIRSGSSTAWVEISPDSFGYPAASTIRPLCSLGLLEPQASDCSELLGSVACLLPFRLWVRAPLQLTTAVFSQRVATRYNLHKLDNSTCLHNDRAVHKLGIQQTCVVCMEYVQTSGACSRIQGLQRFPCSLCSTQTVHMMPFESMLQNLLAELRRLLKLATSFCSSPWAEAPRALGSARQGYLPCQR